MDRDSIFEFRETGKEMMIGLKNSENEKQDKRTLLNFNKETEKSFLSSTVINRSYKIIHIWIIFCKIIIRVAKWCFKEEGEEESSDQHTVIFLFSYRCDLLHSFLFLGIPRTVQLLSDWLRTQFVFCQKYHSKNIILITIECVEDLDNFTGQFLHK